MEQPMPMPLACPDCAAQMPETAAYCPGCGRSMQSAPRASGTVGVFSEKIAGALAYLTFVPAIVFLVLQPYNKNRFVRFHSAQCLLVWIVAVIAAAVIRLAGIVVFWIPVAGPLLLLLIWVLAAIATVLLWLVLVVKAVQGETFKLPVLGEIAEHYANPL